MQSGMNPRTNAITKVAYYPNMCEEENVYWRSLRTNKEVLVHLNAKNGNWKESLGDCIENFGPRGPKDKVLKIKSN